MARTPKVTIPSGDQKEDATEKMNAIKMAMEQIERQYGKGSIMRFGEAAKRLQIDVIPTGALPLDIALGVGGLPRGRIVEIRRLPRRLAVAI
ncbi:MAG TPA: hypothetical protein PLD54_05120, partial [Candidatus Levybacteria bacterium]|nr:hypothetical protein [Candidatus Levybacteria bacterium]